MKNTLKILICGFLLVGIIMSVAACGESNTEHNSENNTKSSSENNNSQDTESYYLTVQDPNGYILENLQESYSAGENVTVKTEVLLDVDMIAYLDDVSLGCQKAVLEDDEYHWEFYFVMPAHDAVLRFELSGGM